MPTGQKQEELELELESSSQEKTGHKWYSIKQSQRSQLERELEELK